MKVFGLAYLTSALVFLGLDAVWLSQMGPRLYKPLLRGLLAEQVRPAPAIIFYGLYLAGIVIFAVLPAPRPAMALWRGAVFGLIAYATSDLTNQATMRGWPTVITLADLAWGAFATATAATVACMICQWLLRS